MHWGAFVGHSPNFKVTGAVPTYYPRSGAAARRTKGVERRAQTVPGEYRRPLQRSDARYRATAPDEVGPLVQRLLSFGRLQVLVVGAWQEGSNDLHHLLDLLTEIRVKRMGLGMGRELSSRERAKIISNYRRVVSVTAARATSGCLVGRLARIGPAHRAAARRRDLIRREQERMEQEMEAHWRVNVVGRGLMRGRFAI